MTNTRITANSQTTIDHVITNQPTVQTIVTHEAISDHQVLITSLGQKTQKTPTNCPTTLQQKLDITETERKIKSLSWKTWLIENQNNDLETTYNNFHKTIQSCVTLQQRHTHRNIPTSKLPLQPHNACAKGFAGLRYCRRAMPQEPTRDHFLNVR